jgi:hypothetical protein
MVRFVEELFDLPSLGQLDAVSDDLADMFNFTQTPTPFTPFALAHTLDEVERAAREPRKLPPGATPDD